jgi:hypothetical protein
VLIPLDFDVVNESRIEGKDKVPQPVAVNSILSPVVPFGSLQRQGVTLRQCDISAAEAAATCDSLRQQRHFHRAPKFRFLYRPNEQRNLEMDSTRLLGNSLGSILNPINNW